MLCLSRRPGERIRIRTPDGTEIWVVLVEVDRNKVKIGIQAPLACEVQREENLTKQPPPASGQGREGGAK
jgi:carbon storage regulator CsrA